MLLQNKLNFLGSGSDSDFEASVENGDVLSPMLEENESDVIEEENYSDVIEDDDEYEDDSSAVSIYLH